MNFCTDVRGKLIQYGKRKRVRRMKKVLFFVMVLALGGCANQNYEHQAAQMSDAQMQQQLNSNVFDTFAADLEKKQKEGKITQLELAKGLYGAQQHFIPNETAYGTYLAYRIVIAQQLDKKEITGEEFQARNQALFAEYLERQKQEQRQIQAQHNAQAQALQSYRSAAGAQAINNSLQRYQQGMKPLTPMMNCMSTPLGGGVSTTCY